MIDYYANLIVSFLIFGSYTMYIDYKTNTSSNKELNKIYNKIIPNVLFNVHVLSIPAIYCFIKLLDNPSYHLLGNLPLPAKYLAMPLLVDIIFYSMHRLLHNKYLYYFHKRHHELINPVGIGSFYMSPIEFYLAIVIPIFAPLVLLGANNINSHLWLTFSVFNGICIAHSNNLDFNISNFHYYHHNSSMYNYGIDIFMDRLFNTRKN